MSNGHPIGQSSVTVSGQQRSAAKQSLVRATATPTVCSVKVNGQRGGCVKNPPARDRHHRSSHETPNRPVSSSTRTAPTGGDAHHRPTSGGTGATEWERPTELITDLTMAVPSPNEAMTGTPIVQTANPHQGD